MFYIVMIFIYFLNNYVFLIVFVALHIMNCALFFVSCSPLNQTKQ